MSFPDPSLAVPNLQPWQMWYRGLTFGGVVSGAPFQLLSLEGFDQPDYVSGDMQRALDSGEWEGIDLAPGRDVTIKQAISFAGEPGATGGEASAAQLSEQEISRQQLAGVMGPSGNQSSPLYVRTPRQLYVLMARARKHKYVINNTLLVGGGLEASTLLHASDPRWYAAPTKAVATALPQAPTGGTFPAHFPFTFGGAGYRGLVACQNNGNFEMRPRLVFTGPVTNPTASNLSRPGAPTIGINYALQAGEELEVDTDVQAVLLRSAPGSPAAERRDLLTWNTTWWNLPPGESAVAFGSSDASRPAGILTVKYADAFIGV